MFSHRGPDIRQYGRQGPVFGGYQQEIDAVGLLRRFYQGMKKTVVNPQSFLFQASLSLSPCDDAEIRSQRVLHSPDEIGSHRSRA